MKKLCDYQAGPTPDPNRDIHTKYFTLDFLEKLRKVDEPVDIAGCKFTPPCASAINILLGSGIEVRDSEDPVRDALLQNNFKAYKESPTPTVSMPFKRVRNATELKAFVSEMDPGLIYNVTGWEDMHFPISILIQMLYPEYKFDYGVYLDKLFRTLHFNLYQSETSWFIKNTDEFSMLYDQTYVRIPNVTRDMDTPFEVPFYGKRTWRTMLDTAIFIPSYFGEVPISKDKTLCSKWRNVAMCCTRSLIDQGQTLFDLIKELQNV